MLNITVMVRSLDKLRRTSAHHDGWFDTETSSGEPPLNMIVF